MVYIVGWNTRMYIRASRHHSKWTYFTYSNEINDTFGLRVKQHFAENRTTHAKHLVTAKADMTSPLQMTLATVINKLAKNNWPDAVFSYAQRQVKGFIWAVVIFIGDTTKPKRAINDGWVCGLQLSNSAVIHDSVVPATCLHAIRVNRLPIVASLPCPRSLGEKTLIGALKICFPRSDL